MLRGGVGGDVARSHLGRHGRDVHDPPPAALHHAGKEGPRAEKRAGGVDRHHPVPVFERDPGERRGRGRPGVVHENVDLAEPLRSRIVHDADALGVRDVAAERPRLSPF